MCAVILALIFLSAIGGTHTVDVARCSNGTQSKLTLTPHNDGVVGRYLAEMCMDLEPEATSWKLTLTFYDKDNNCKHPPLMGIHRPGKIHSTYEQTITVDGNCSHVCLNTTFDLIFSACYAIESFFIVNGYTRHITYTYFNIKNNYTMEYFMNNSARFDVLNHDEANLTMVWHTGVPFVDFEVSVCKVLNATADVIELESECTHLGGAECRAPAAAELRCRAALAPACYELLLTLHAAWAHGAFRDQGLVNYILCQPAPLRPAASGTTWAWAWAAAALAALGAGGAALRGACRSRGARKLHKAVLREWLVLSHEPAPAAAPAARRVLLLYAREGPEAARLAAALADLLRAAPATQVYDIFSPAVVALSAGAPAAWLRGMIARDDVAVVIVQTPALALLYQTHLSEKDNELTLSVPLLGRRVAYRAPQYGDALLRLAARLAAEAGAAPHYRKYFLATVSGIETEVFPALAPYRRYVLPGAAALLQRDACGGTISPGLGGEPSAAALAAVRAAAAALAQRARAQPDYLMDELVFL